MRFDLLNKSLLLSLAAVAAISLFAHSAGDLPVPGGLVAAAQKGEGPLLKGVTVDPEDPFRLEFIVDGHGQHLSEDEVARRSNIFNGFDFAAG